MRIAVISDLHADLEALELALAHIRNLGCERVVCLGDLVDGGVFPDELIERLRAEAIDTIRGNHDRWAIAAGRGEDTSDIYGGGWELSVDSIRFLEALPVSWNAYIEGVRVVAWHASVGSDMNAIEPGYEGRALERADADVLLVGHTHEARVVRVAGGGMVANPGALWTGAKEGGTFGVLELPARRFRVYAVRDGAEVDL